MFLGVTGQLGRAPRKRCHLGWNVSKTNRAGRNSETSLARADSGSRRRPEGQRVAVGQLRSREQPSQVCILGRSLESRTKGEPGPGQGCWCLGLEPGSWNQGTCWEQSGQHADLMLKRWSWAPLLPSVLTQIGPHGLNWLVKMRVQSADFQTPTWPSDVKWDPRLH